MSKEAMKLALEALKNFEKAGLATLKTIDAITALKQALEQPEPEPVECHTCKGLGRIYMGCGSWIHCDTCNTTGKATTQPKREPPCKTGSQCTTKCMECAEPTPVAWANRVIGGRKWLSIHASKGASDKWLEYRIKEQAQGEKYEQVALYKSPPKREPEPVIDKSAAIRIATSLGWTPKREWVGLTEREVDECYELVMYDMDIEPSRFRVYQAIEAKLKEKNT